MGGNSQLRFQADPGAIAVLVFPAPFQGAGTSYAPTGGCARGLADPRLFSLVPPGTNGGRFMESRHLQNPDVSWGHEPGRDGSETANLR